MMRSGSSDVFIVPILLAACLGIFPPLFIGKPALAAEEGAASEETVDPDADYSGELPRIPPREPQDSLRALRTLPGFRVELVASEPQIEDPIAISFDAAGRMYVVCMRGYGEQPDELLGQIRRLEDLDGDGHYERSSVFVDELSWPTGVICRPLRPSLLTGGGTAGRTAARVFDELLRKARRAADDETLQPQIRAEAARTLDLEKTIDLQTMADLIAYVLAAE